MSFKEGRYFFTQIYGCKFDTNGLNNQSMGKVCNAKKGSVKDIKCSPFNLEDLWNEIGTFAAIDTPLTGVAVVTHALAFEAISVCEKLT